MPQLSAEQLWASTADLICVPSIPLKSGRAESWDKALYKTFESSRVFSPLCEATTHEEF